MILPRFIENLHQNPDRTRGFQSGLASIPYSDQSETSIDLAAAAYLGPVRFTLKPACLASFFSRNSVFLSQQFSQNSIFQSVSAKFQQTEQGHSDGQEWL